MNKLKERFLKFFDESLWAQVVGLYSEEGRYYHNLDHVADCLNEFDSARGLCTNPENVERAIWLHDVIYDTKQKDNEEVSAKFALDNLPQPSADKVSGLILATKHLVVPESVDGQIMVDVDLAHFGRSYVEFIDISDRIRKEYSWVSDSDFRDGRKKVLQGFLDKENIYASDFFRRKYEVKARENLGRAIGELD